MERWRTIYHSWCNHDESMEAAKDVWHAMYGSRGANGVIIVTTKQGAEGKSTGEHYCQ